MSSDKVLRRTYTFHILDNISRGKELTFTQILQDLGISRGALSATLDDLVENELVHRRQYGRFVYYRITEKGQQMLQKYSQNPDFLEDQMAQIVYTHLQEDYASEIAKFPKEYVIESIRPRIRQFIDSLSDDILKKLTSDTEIRKPLSKIDAFTSENMSAILESIIDVDTIAMLRKEVKRIKTLKKLSNPITATVKMKDGKDALYMGCKSTKIFCRLTCPCRMPQPKNIRFFKSSDEAIASGYRACKICKPV